MKAMNNISLPRVSKTDDYTGVQTEERNEANLQQNFRMISNAVNTLEETQKKMPDEILAKVIKPDAYILSSDSDGIWDWMKWSDNKIDAVSKTAPTVVNCTTASGTLFSGEMTVSFPTGLFTTISAAFISPICSAYPVIATIKSVSATQIVVTVLSTTSNLVTLELCIQLYGE